jgi:hypothetical protein
MQTCELIYQFYDTLIGDKIMQALVSNVGFRPKKI